LAINKTVMQQRRKYSPPVSLA